MFASRAFATSQTGHRCASAATFTNAREAGYESEDQPIQEVEDDKHPNRCLACALVSSIFCPILGAVALFYAIRALRTHNQGFYAEATTFYKQSIQWSLMTFIIGLTIGSIIIFGLFVKAVVFV